MNSLECKKGKAPRRGIARVVGLVAAISVVLASPAHAFSCHYKIPHPATAYLQESDAVFVGRVLADARQPPPNEKYGPEGYVSSKLTVKVVRSFKSASEGATVPVEALHSAITFQQPPQFEIDRDYLFPVGVDSKTGSYKLHLCAGFFEVDQHAQTLLELSEHKGN
jgi:hypothetical protein